MFFAILFVNKRMAVAAKINAFIKSRPFKFLFEPLVGAGSAGYEMMECQWLHPSAHGTFAIFV